MGLFENQVAVVTGAASGIGAATARRLSDEGATVVVADIDVDGGEKSAIEVGCSFRYLDVTDADAWSTFIDEVVADYGRLDVAHLNAGVHPGVADICELDLDTYRTHVSVNVDGVFFGLRETLRAMRAQSPPGGSVVITASLASLIAYPIDPVYNMTKHAVLGLMRGASMTAGPGITINTVNPGIVNTPMLGAEGLEMLEGAGFPVIEPADVAEAVVQTATSGRSGEAWVVQPGVCEPFKYANVPGPRTEGDKGKAPPISPDGRLGG
ncbi:MAG TPA: SDR family oxidoreductase [Acidimicrobiales bacterium]|jgi:NAD(P)-dependent dehydrogenase (short-subunit alcohol dehydrogenase family)